MGRFPNRERTYVQFMAHLRLLSIEYAIGDAGDMQTVYAPYGEHSDV